MKDMNQTQNPRIERGTTYLVVPVRKGEARFVSPAIGPGTYDSVVKEVLARKLNLPTGEHDAFLLDEVYNSEVSDFKDSQEAEFVKKNIMKNGWLWVPNVNVWTPKNVKNPGVYVVFDEKGQGRDQKIDVSRLEDQLSGGSTEKGVKFSKDRKVSFAPLNTIKSGYHDKGTLAQDGAVIANYGFEGAEKIDNVARTFSGKPYSWIIDNTTDQPIQTLSALDRNWSDGGRLYAYFNNLGGYGYGCAFGESGSK